MSSSVQKPIEVPFPKERAFSLNLPDLAFKAEMKKLALVKPYDSGRISSGKAAQLLEISRIDFIDMLGQYQVSPIGFTEESADEGVGLT